MLLKLLHDFAVSRHLLDDLAFKRDTPIRWIIHLDLEGKLLGAGPQETEGKRPNKGKEYDVPKTTRPTGSGQVADFLVDDIGAIFRLNPKPEKELNKRSLNNLKLKHEDFWKQIEAAYVQTNNPAFKAIQSFHKNIGDITPTFLRLEQTGKTRWIVKKADEQEVPLGTDFFTFAVNSEILIANDDIRTFWRKMVNVEISVEENSARKGVCLVTGQQNMPLARTHTPMITGLHKNDQIKQRGIVGFEGDSFRSYGFEQSYNAPTSIMASKAYLRALQYLSGEGCENHWLSLGPAWLCFWAAETEPASGIFAKLWNKPDPLTIRSFIVSPWAGLEKAPPDNEKFYAVALTASGPRIVIKDWRESTLKQASENFKIWFKDLEIHTPFKAENPDDNSHAPLSMYWLACTTIRPDSNGKYDRDALKTDLLVSLYNAALTGAAPSISLLNPILERLKARFAKDGKKALKDESRFALLKLILNRNRKESDMEIKPGLTADTDDPAYNCGRLLSVFDDLQQRAHEWKLEGPTVAERYYGSASTSPSTAFGILWRLHLHHLKKLRNLGGKYGAAAIAIERRIMAICSLMGQTEEMRQKRLPPSLPRTLNLQAQGRFALGYYQQKAEDKAGQEAVAAEKAKVEVK